jgi:hypothetical protein
VNGTLAFLAIMDIRARARSKGPERPVGSPVRERDGETVSPSPHSSSQTSAGKPNNALGVSLSRPLGATVARSPHQVSDEDDEGTAAIPLVNLSPFMSGGCLCDACLIGALLCQHCPADHAGVSPNLRKLMHLEMNLRGFIWRVVAS